MTPRPGPLLGSGQTQGGGPGLTLDGCTEDRGGWRGGPPTGEGERVVWWSAHRGGGAGGVVVGFWGGGAEGKD